MDLEALQRIKQWHVSHQREHPVEYHAWDAMLTLWLMGWVGRIPAFTFDALWSAPCWRWPWRRPPCTSPGA